MPFNFNMSTSPGNFWEYIPDRPEQEVTLVSDSGSSGEVADNAKNNKTCSSSVNNNTIKNEDPLHAPIVSHFNHQVRPLLDAIDRLRLLNVMKEGIQLPTIVVVGDQSSGKSSVLESLAGVSLPKGTGICTRVPLVMRLQNHPSSEISLEYNGKTVPVEESHIPSAINLATNEIAGDGKGIGNSPLSLVIKKEGVPDLTMVDLPGITRVPVHGQPDDIYDQVKGIIMKYIAPKESIILNVLSATVDFSTCESIRMSHEVDKSGERTLAVVTKADMSPQGLFEKVNSDDVNIGLGYVCVRNRLGKETYDEARKEEARLFEMDPNLKKIDSSMVGITVLATKLVDVQEKIIAKCLPGIIRSISTKLGENLSALASMPKHLATNEDALKALMKIIGAAKTSLSKLLLRGEFNEYPEDRNMHGTARLAEMLDNFVDALRGMEAREKTKDFLKEEIVVLEESRDIGLPNFLPRNAFNFMLQKKVDRISNMPVEFAEKYWNYIEEIVTIVLMSHSETYYQLKSATKRAAHAVVENIKQQTICRVKEIVEEVKWTGYTCNPNYVTEWDNLMQQREIFFSNVEKAVQEEIASPKLNEEPGSIFKFGGLRLESSLNPRVNLEGFGVINVGHLRERSSVVQDAFDLKMRMASYWNIVVVSLVDSTARHLNRSLQKLVDSEIDEILIEVMESDKKGIAKLLVESTVISAKRETLNRRIQLLKEAKEVVSSIMVKISSVDDN